MILKSLLLASFWILSALAQQQTEADCIYGLEEWNVKLQKCVTSCTEGKVFNEASDNCEDPVPVQCTPGLEEWNSKLGRCTTVCKQGLIYNEDTQTCEIDNEIRSSTCSRECGEGETLDKNVCRCTMQLDDCCKASSSDYDIRLVSTPNCDCEKKCEDQGSDYKCVTTHICRNGEINTDGEGILVTYSAETIDVSDHACPNHLTCCKNPGNITEPRTPRTPPPVDLNQCGRIATGGLRLVDSSNDGDKIEDYTAQIGEFPHMCIFYSQSQGSQAYRGGASLIGTKFLLTAAHKLHYVKSDKTHDIREESLSARCGVLNAKRVEPNFPDPQDRFVTKLLIHPEFDPSLLTHNIAILYVRESFKLENHISPVCLPKPNFDYTGSTDCYSTGFGAATYDRPAYSDLLKKVKLPVVDSKQCQETIQALPRFNEKKFIVYDNWICVGGEGEEDTCRGDGGSPHVCKHNNQWVQVGAVAFGFGCGKEGIPSVYSAVAPEMCWIDWVMSCQEYLPESVSNVVDQRTTGAQITVESVNGIPRRDCSQWLNNHPDLLQQCKVNYL